MDSSSDRLSEHSQPDGDGDLNEEQFVRWLTDEQVSLQNYISMLLGDAHAARNVLQETNMVAWRKSADFTPGTNFSAWVRKIAFWQVQAYVRDQRRDRHVFFSDELISQLANQNASRLEDEDTEPRIALRHCLSHLSRPQLELLRQRYEEDASISVLAGRAGKTPSAIKVGLMRLRRALLKCIEKELKYDRPTAG